MGFTSNLNGLTIIDDSNADLYVQQVLDPNYPFSGGYIERDYKVDGLSRLYSGNLYPESDWEAMIQDREEREATLTHLHTRLDVPVLDQNGYPHCTDSYTEVLTEARGWVKWPDYDGRDRLGTINPQTQMLEYQVPSARQIFEHKGEMICSTNRRVKFAMTPQHRMYVRKWDESKRTLSGNYSFTTADSLGWYAGLLAAPSGSVGTNLVEVEVEGDRCYDGDDFVAMLAMIISCGYAGGSESTKNRVSFCCFDESRYDAVAALAVRVGFHETPDRKGVWERRDAAALADWIRRKCYDGRGYRSENKQIPRLLQETSMRQIKLFLIWFADQKRATPMTCYSSSSWKLVGDLQEMLFKIGKRSTPCCTGPKTSEWEGKIFNSKESWKLNVATTDRLCLDRKKHIEQDRYNGLVYCATVPNGTLVTRYEGTVLVSGNCWAFGYTGAKQMAYAQQGMAVPHLSGNSLAAKVNNYTKKGGWAKYAAEMDLKVGQATVEFWPEHDYSRANDTPEMRKNALLHMIDPQIGYEELQPKSFAELVSALLDNRPTTMGLAWWGHLVFGLRPVIIERGSIGIEIMNSWKKTWENGGKAVLRKERAIADEMLMIKCVRPIAKAA